MEYEFYKSVYAPIINDYMNRGIPCIFLSTKETHIAITNFDILEFIVDENTEVVYESEIDSIAMTDESSNNLTIYELSRESYDMCFDVFSKLAGILFLYENDWHLCANRIIPYENSDDTVVSYHFNGGDSYSIMSNARDHENIKVW